MATTIIKDITHEEWLKIRTEGLGSSEFGTALGLNSYTTPYQLALRKRAERNGEINEIQNEAMIMGHLAEDMVARRWEMATGKEVIKSSAGDWLVKCDRRPYMQASPDRTYWLDSDAKKNDDNKGILECKTTNLNLSEETASLITISDERGDHIIPMTWYCQVQYLLACSERKHGCLAWYRLMQRQFDYVYIDFDEEWFEQALKEVDVFWNDCILGERDPELKASDVTDKYPESDGNNEEVEGSFAQMVDTLKNLKAKAKELEANIKEIEEALRARCNASESYSYFGKVLWTFKSSKPSVTFDKARFELENPELYKKYLTEKPGSRRFVIK